MRTSHVHIQGWESVMALVRFIDRGVKSKPLVGVPDRVLVLWIKGQNQNLELWSIGIPDAGAMFNTLIEGQDQNLEIVLPGMSDGCSTFY